MQKKESFLLYSSVLTVIEQLPVEIRGKAALIIFDYGAGREITDPYVKIDDTVVDLRKYFRQVFNGIDVEKRRYANKERVSSLQEEITNRIEANDGTIDIKQAEQVVKALKRLYNEVKRHDVVDVEERIKSIIRGVSAKGIDRIPTDTMHQIKHNIIKSWLDNLSEEDGKKLTNLIGAAENNKTASYSDSGRPIRAR